MKTYSHLASARRVPSDYELLSTRLLYSPPQASAVATEAQRWLAGHVTQLTCPDWEAFTDPRGTTYFSYTFRQRDQEVHTQGLLDAADDRALSAEARTALAAVLGPARFPFHGLQMAAAGLGQLAPSGRVVLTCLFQAADELRRVHRFAYRLRQLQLAGAVETADDRARWTGDPAWQPAREAVERLLVTYAWDEAFAALNLVLKPTLDALLLDTLARRLRAAGDETTPSFLRAFRDDAAWQRAWTAALCRLLVAADVSNRERLRGFVDAWVPRAEAAAAGLAVHLGADAIGDAVATRQALLADSSLDEEAP